MMDEKQFPLERMRATAQTLSADADTLRQEISARLTRIDQAELQLPPRQQATIEELLAALRSALQDIVDAEHSIADELRASADEAETAESTTTRGLSTN